MRDESSIVKFENISLEYPGCPAIFNDVSFRLTPGSFTFLNGANSMPNGESICRV